MTERGEHRPGTWRIGRIAGADLLVRPSLLIMAGLLVVVFANRFRDVDANPWVVAGSLVLAVYLSIVVHELAHLAAARSHGQSVRSITLHLLGGETAIEGESRTPGQEFTVAVVGPIASAVLGFLILFVARFAEGTPETILWYLGALNVVLAVFNMLPAWPMDGGRVLRALVWAVTGSESAGTRFAGRVSRVAAVALLTVGGYLFLRQGPHAEIDLFVCLLIAWFLWVGASAALQHANRMSRVEHLSAARFAEPGDTAGLPRIPADAAGEQLVRAMAAHPAATYALVGADGTPQGILRASAVEDAYRRGGGHA